MEFLTRSHDSYQLSRARLFGEAAEGKTLGDGLLCLRGVGWWLLNTSSLSSAITDGEGAEE